MLTIREIVESDQAHWVRLRDALWPGSLSDHDAETREYFEKRPKAPIIFVAEADGRLVGFLELDYRKYAPGCRSSPVPFIEGWYVEPALRGRGTGRALVEAAEAHARAAGHYEIASDAELENTDGIAAHHALGYEQVERVVCFRRSLRDASEIGARCRFRRREMRFGRRGLRRHRDDDSEQAYDSTRDRTRNPLSHNGSILHPSGLGSQRRNSAAASRRA